MDDLGKGEGMENEATDVVGQIIEESDRIAVPSELIEQFQRHHEHLIELATSLLANGKSASEVREIISTVLESFQRELTRTIASLQEPDLEHRA